MPSNDICFANFWCLFELASRVFQPLPHPRTFLPADVAWSNIVAGLKFHQNVCFYHGKRKCGVEFINFTRLRGRITTPRPQKLDKFNPTLALAVVLVIGRNTFNRGFTDLNVGYVKHQGYLWQQRLSQDYCQFYYVV